jgi:hypothetical protein
MKVCCSLYQNTAPVGNNRIKVNKIKNKITLFNLSRFSDSQSADCFLKKSWLNKDVAP